MDQQSFVLRPANPTYDEGLVFAYYLDEAFEGLFRMALGQSLEDIVAKAFIEPDHDFSYQNTIFAERDKVIVGMATGYAAEQHRASSNQPLKQAAHGNIIQKIGAGLLCYRLRFLGTHADGDFYLQAIAVAEKHRNKGIGTVLMDGIEDLARSFESTRLFLDAAAKNERARKFYERRGMTVASEWFSSPIMPTFIVQMTKLL
jgi:ribosomal protein S18 acetylase RimI-like enzyme